MSSLVHERGSCLAMKESRGRILDEGLGRCLFEADVVFNLEQKRFDGDARRRLDEEARRCFAKVGLWLRGRWRGAFGTCGGAEGHSGQGKPENAHTEDHEKHFHRSDLTFERPERHAEYQSLRAEIKDVA